MYLISKVILTLTFFCYFLSTLNILSVSAQPDDFSNFFNTGHTNNWAVLVCTSRFWFNYRHVANVLSIYRSVKRLGIPDSRTILMLADDMACNPRNPRAATVFNNAHHHINVYGDDVEVDYRGYEVTVENFIRLLTGRLPPSTPRSKRLLSDEHSNILIYMTGHGGEGFLKFQDSEEITNVELADAFEQMWQKRRLSHQANKSESNLMILNQSREENLIFMQSSSTFPPEETSEVMTPGMTESIEESQRPTKRYRNIFFMIDTCQAESMFLRFYSPNILAVASSKIGEDSLSHHGDPTIGVYVIDRYTYYALEFLEKVDKGSTKTMGQFLQVCPKRVCISTVTSRKDLFPVNPDNVLLTDFFGSIRSIELTRNTIELPPMVLNSTAKLNKAKVKWNYVEQFPF